MRHVPLGNQAARVEAPGTAPGSERFITTPVYHHSHPCGRHPEYRREGGKKKRGGQGLGGALGRGAPFPSLPPPTSEGAHRGRGALALTASHGPWNIRGIISRSLAVFVKT